MLFALRKAYFPHLTINFTFPIRGHSFLPADRVFGRIEQDLRRKDTILLPSDYHAVLRSHGTLLIYGDDWKAQDFKATTSRLTKTTRSFKISEARVLEICGNELGFKSSYHGEFCNHSILSLRHRDEDYTASVCNETAQHNADEEPRHQQRSPQPPQQPSAATANTSTTKAASGVPSSRRGLSGRGSAGGGAPPPRPGHLDLGAVAGDKDDGAAEVGKVGAGAPARNDTVDGGPQRRTSDAIPVGEASRLAP